MTDQLKDLWTSLNAALRQAIKYAQPARKSNALEFDAPNHILKWEMFTTVQEPKDSPWPCPTFHISKAAEQEFQWLITDHDISMTLKAIKKSGPGMESHQAWEATVARSRRLSTENTPRPETEFQPSNLAFEVMFSPLLFAGFTGRSPKEVWLTDAYRGDKSVTHTFCGSHPTQSDESPSCIVVSEIIGDICDYSGIECPTPCCTVRARTFSATTFLAMHASRAAAKLTAQCSDPVALKTTPDSEIGQILCGDVAFWIDFGRIIKASPVFAACFSSDKFAESKKRQYDMSAFSAEAVEQFVLFCSNGQAPKCADFALELAEIAHQYEVHRLVVVCEIHLIRELLYCGNIRRLGEIAAVATKLELRLLLATYEVLLRDHLWDWMWAWSDAQKNTWFDVVAGLPDFDRRRLDVLSSVRRYPSLYLSDDFQVTCKPLPLPVVPLKP